MQPTKSDDEALRKRQSERDRKKHNERLEERGKSGVSKVTWVNRNG